MAEESARLGSAHVRKLVHVDRGEVEKLGRGRLGLLGNAPRLGLLGSTSRLGLLGSVPRDPPSRGLPRDPTRRPHRGEVA
ncbi:hypothetical protein BHM03_00044527 [Ensete ventricosum]|uniref:Uncharacterized protein n=1 Tax=Ensete ventricosum TaxID=4639 RepID=A0A445MKT3_ENSVE|nr:hypothetical protein BHM03_00044527 [Ensete ventricosum]